MLNERSSDSNIEPEQKLKLKLILTPVRPVVRRYGTLSNSTRHDSHVTALSHPTAQKSKSPKVDSKY